MFAFFLILFPLLIAYLCNFYIIKRRSYPPGPFPLPIFGNAYSLLWSSQEDLVHQWKGQYGDIMTVWFGSLPMITIHDSKLIYDTFVKDGESYAGRITKRFNELMRPGHGGLVFSEGPLWRENRRFALHVFRNLGLGRNIMQERVLEDVCGLVEHVSSEVKSGKTEFNLFDEIDLAVGSIINSMTFGYRFSRANRSEFERMKKVASEAMVLGASPLQRTMEPHYEYFRYLPVFSGTYEKVVKLCANMRKILNNQIENHKKGIDLESTEEPTDYVEAFLRQKHKLDLEGVKDHNFSDNQLYSALLDLWLAGQETTATTLAWFVIYVIQNPQVQQKAHAELDEFIADSRIVTLDDKLKLNYINAVIAETQRMCNLLPINVPHKTTKDVEINGYKIPKNTVILNQISTVLYDERYFPDAKAFKPERFLDENGKFFQPSEFMPFSVGKRACLGEGLARLELFLFAANMLNQFKFGEIDEKPISGKRIFGLTVSPTPWVCSVQLRHLE